MFSSEQKFAINGDDDENLKRVLKLALEMSGEKIKSFYIDEKGLVFCNRENSNTTRYPFEPTIPVIIEQVKQYIDGLSSEKVLELAGKPSGCDGAVVLGWEIFYPMYPDFNEYSIESYEIDEIGAFLAVRPSWIVYHK